MDIVDKDFDSLFCVVLVVEAIMRMEQMVVLPCWIFEKEDDKDG